MAQAHYDDEAVAADDGPAVLDDGALLAPPELEQVSVRDEEAFAQRHLQDLGQEVDAYRVFHWRISNYRNAGKKLTSPEFECGGHKWNILLFPNGNQSTGQANDMVSVYLNYGDPKHAKEGWHVCAQFALAISNPNDPTCFIQSQAHHRFNHDECDWGFTRFVELRKLFAPADQRPRPVIEGDETIVTAFVRVLKDPTGVLWHNFQNYDSKKETGHVGLKNQGATCYMNSLLQSLFLTNVYRKAVYQIPTEKDSLDSVPLALQRVFYLLQTSDQPVSTTELTKSFGWKGFDSFLQHDVQEFNRVLQDKLETKMKGTDAEGTIVRLFGGKMKSFIRCVDVDFESARSEDYLGPSAMLSAALTCVDIQLNVRDNRTLYDSFKQYCEVENMDGENKYAAEGHGLQDARKGYIFESFPPVLHLQLKRFEYDMQRDVNIKINDRHEFPFEIDLADFLDEAADRTESCVYQLHGVLVHSGDVHGGHYFVLIKPTADGEWFRFDDDRVVRVTDREVLEENFGGEPLGLDAQRPPVKGAQKRFTNAYMLVYIRKSRVREILAPLSVSDTPDHLRSRLERERADAEQRRKDREEQHLYLTTKIITDTTFAEHQGFDLATFEDRFLPMSELVSLRVPKTQLFADFKTELVERLNLEGDVRLWVLVNRQNKTVRPDAVVPDTDLTMTMELVRDRMASRQHDLKLYLEHQPPGERQQWEADYPGETPIMVFVKKFDVESQSLVGIGHFYVHRHLRVADLVAMINAHQGYPVGTALRVYEEIKPGMIELMKQKATFLQSEIQDGDIVCYQTELSEQTLTDPSKPHQCLTPPAFYEWLLNRIAVRFRAREDANVPDAPEFELVLSRKDTYDRVGEHLHHDPAKLRLTTAHPQTGMPASKSIRRLQNNQTLADLLQPTYQQSPAYLLYYEQLDMSLVELETKKNVKVTWMGLHNKEESTHFFLQPKTSTLGDLQDIVAKTVTLSADGSQKIRVFTVHSDGRKMRTYNNADKLADVRDDDVYAEEIPIEEGQTDGTDDFIVGCYHFQKDPTRPHGVPFRFVVRHGEPFVETKKRLQVRIGASDKELSRMKFVLYQPQMYAKPNSFNDEDIISQHRWHDEELLGIDSPNKKRGPVEQSIKIKG